MFFGKKPQRKQLQVASVVLTDYTGSGSRTVSADELPTLRSYELQLAAYVTDQFREYRLYFTKVISPDRLTQFQDANGVFLTGYLLMQQLTHETALARIQQLLTSIDSHTHIYTWRQLDFNMLGYLQPMLYSPHLLPDPAAPAGYKQAAAE